MSEMPNMLYTNDFLSMFIPEEVFASIVVDAKVASEHL